MTSTEHVIDFNDLVLTDKDVFGDWEYLICENDGCFSQDSQALYFDYKGLEVVIQFELTIRGNFWYTPASYMEPEDGETNITDVEIDVNYLSIESEEIIPDKALKKTLSEVVKKYVKYE